MFDRLFHMFVEIAIFCGLVAFTVVTTKFGFDYVFRYFAIEPFSPESYGYMTTIYSIFIAILLHKLDANYRKVNLLYQKISQLNKKIIGVEDEEHHLKEEIVKVLS